MVADVAANKKQKTMKKKKLYLFNSVESLSWTDSLTFLKIFQLDIRKLTVVYLSDYLSLLSEVDSLDVLTRNISSVN